MPSALSIRREHRADGAAIRAVHTAAFGNDAEANLVDALRQHAAPLVSLVAEDRGEIVGHVLFSPVILAMRPELTMMGLAPMAVMPMRQRQGIGAQLIAVGLDQCRDLKACAVVVLGHPTYYPRFGFVPAAGFSIRSEYDVPDDVFMIRELRDGALAGVEGIVRYHSAFLEFGL